MPSPDPEGMMTRVSINRCNQRLASLLKGKEQVLDHRAELCCGEEEAAQALRDQLEETVAVLAEHDRQIQAAQCSLSSLGRLRRQREYTTTRIMTDPHRLDATPARCQPFHISHYVGLAKKVE